MNRSIIMNPSQHMYRALHMAFINFLCVVTAWVGLDILVSLVMGRAWIGDLTNPVPLTFMSLTALAGSIAMYFCEKRDEMP